MFPFEAFYVPLFYIWILVLLFFFFIYDLYAF